MRILIPLAKDASNHPNAPRDATVKETTYWRCVEACVNSIYVTNKNAEAEIEIIADHEPPASTKRFLDFRQIKIIKRQFRYDPGLNAKFYRSSFYKIDALELASKTRRDTVIIDPDVLFIKSVDPLIDALKKCDVLIYSLDSREVKDPHFGMTRAEILSSIPKKLLAEGADVLNFFIGGEVIAINGASTGLVFELFSNLFVENVRRKSLFKTEEHIYSCVPALSIRSQKINEFVCRSWTHLGATYLCKPSDSTIIVHLPAEKSVLLKILSRTKYCLFLSNAAKQCYFSLIFSDFSLVRKLARLSFSCISRLIS
jgi:hypothetical protein